MLAWMDSRSGRCYQLQSLQQRWFKIGGYKDKRHLLFDETPNHRLRLGSDWI